MGNESIVLEGGHVRLEPLDLWHANALAAAAAAVRSRAGFSTSSGEDCRRPSTRPPPFPVRLRLISGSQVFVRIGKRRKRVQVFRILFGQRLENAQSLCKYFAPSIARPR